MSSPFHFTALRFKNVQAPLENNTLVPKWQMKILRAKVCLFISVKVCRVPSIPGTWLYYCSGDLPQVGHLVIETDSKLVGK